MPAIPLPSSSFSTPIAELLLNDDNEWADATALGALEGWSPSSDGPHMRTRRRILESPIPPPPSTQDDHSPPCPPHTRSVRNLERERRRQERTAELKATAEAQQAAVAAADAAGVTAAVEGTTCVLPATSALTVLQAKQLFAQVLMQAQLLLQTVALAGQREPSELVCKRWGWKSKEISESGDFRTELVSQLLFCQVPWTT